MKYTNEAKVGFLVLSGLVIFFAMIAYLGAFHNDDKGYPLKVTFKQVSGLREGSLVKYAGVNAGKVMSIKVTPFGVDVGIIVKDEFQIPVNSAFLIGTDGLMGEKFLDIQVGDVEPGVAFYKSGDVVTGTETPSLTALLNSTSNVLQNMNSLVNNVNDVIGKESTKKALEGIVENLYAMSKNMANFSGVLQRMAANNESNVNEMVQNLLTTSQNVNTLVNQVKLFASDVTDNGKTAADLKETLKNIKITSERVEHMAAAIEPLLTDPQTIDNVRVTLQNAREASASANKMLKKFGGFKTTVGTEVMYGGGTGSNPLQTNIDFTAGIDQAYLTAGVQGVGTQNKVNLQVGSMGDNGIGGRIGAVNSEFGVGVDAKVGKSMKLSLDAYDPNDVRLKLRAQYNIDDTTSVVAQNNVINKNRGADSTTFVGLRKEF